MIGDVVNGLFESVGALTQVLNVRRICQDRQVRGVDWRFTVFFAAWGFWNLYYYPSLHQWVSFGAGIVMTGANVVWVLYALYYRSR